MMPKELKRENFNVGPEQAAEIETLRELAELPSKKDALLMAVQLALHLAAETRKGNQIFIGRPELNELRRFVMLGIEKPAIQNWNYLVMHAHPWKRQLFVKGRKLPASAVWISMKANNLDPLQAANNWDLPIEAIFEIVDYCEKNKALLEMEANEELRLLEEKGINVVPKAAGG